MKSESMLYSRYFTYIKPIYKLPVVRNYGPTIFTLFVSALFIFFAIKPTVETILLLQKQIDDSNQVLEKATEKVNNLSLGKKNYDELDPVIKQKISLAIPDVVSLQSLIRSLEETTRIHEASVAALQIQPIIIETKVDQALGKPSEISFTFNIEGGYTDLIEILEEFKRSSRLISIENLSLSKVREGGTLIMSLSGKAYFFK